LLSSVHRRRTPRRAIVQHPEISQKIGGRGWHHHSHAPASPVNGAGGITGCGKDAQVLGSFQPGSLFFGFFRGHFLCLKWLIFRNMAYF
jgi:hypothetical protein